MSSEALLACGGRAAISVVFLFHLSVVGNVVIQLILEAFTVAMAAAPSSEKLLQLQEVDSSRAGSHALSPILSSSSPGLSRETSQPICIHSPYSDLGHDFTSLPFYSPTIFSYAGPSISDCSSVHQSLSASLFWPSHSRVGTPITLHCPQSRPQQGQSVQPPWDSVMTAR